MDCKDEKYDPSVNNDSDTEPGLNNVMEPTGQTISNLERKNLSDWDGFIVNSTRAGSLKYRRGGPLADNGPGKTAGGEKKQKIGRCISCESKNVKLWHGNHYRCHKGEKIKEHASFCGACATGYDEDDDPIPCPKHGENPLPQSEAEKIPLEKVYV